jgi:hypothetical protein
MSRFNQFGISPFQSSRMLVKKKMHTLLIGRQNNDMMSGIGARSSRRSKEREEGKEKRKGNE